MYKVAILDDEKNFLEEIHNCLQENEMFEVSYFQEAKLLIDEIDYFDTSPRSHYVVLHAKHDRKEFIGNLSDIEKQLFPRFLKIHRSYLVALDKIDQLDLKNNQVFIEGNVCLVSRKRKSKLLEEMNRIR